MTTTADKMFEEWVEQYPIQIAGDDYEMCKDAWKAAIAASAQHAPATVPDNSQDWAGMDGATAWHLIDRHADGWSDVGKMMAEWLEANRAQQVEGEAVAVRAQEHWDECKRLAAICPELNLSNYGPDDVDELNAWAIEIAVAVEALAATHPTQPTSAAVPEGYKLLKDSTHAERAWIEDAGHENGLYSNTCIECGREFAGHKRRVICRVCAAAPAPAQPAATAKPEHIPTPDDINAQDWEGMDGATAYQLIERHGEDWSHIGRLMGAWLAANTVRAAMQQKGGAV